MNVKLETEKEIINEDILRIKDVENTPFKMIKMKNEKYKLVVGNHLIAEEEFQNIWQIKKYLNENKWDIVVKLILIINNKMEELKNEKGQKTDN